MIFNTNKKIIEGSVFLALSLSLIIYSIYKQLSEKVSISMSPYLFPILIGGVGIIMALSLIINMTNYNGEEGVSISFKPTLLIKLVVLTSIYIVTMSKIGFILSTVGYLVLMLYALGERRKIMIVCVPILTIASIHLIFSVMLNVILP